METSRGRVEDSDLSTPIASRLRSQSRKLEEEKGKEKLLPGEEEQEEKRLQLYKEKEKHHEDGMEELVRFLKESCHLNGKKTQHALDLMRTLNSVKASQELSNFFMLCNSKAEEEVAHSLALKALEIYENSGKRTLGPQRLYLSISSVEEALASGYASLHISQGPVQTSHPLGRWLGEGHTSHVYIVHVNDEEFAVKVPKSGKNVATDIKYLEKLHGIKGIPVINSTYSTRDAMFTQPVCFKCTKEGFDKENLPVCLAKLVDILKSAHDRSVVNRDVRLENFMIANREPIIVDWGFAAPLSEAVCYSGTTYFASERVLRLLEEGKEVFPCEASDDLVSLVQSLFLFSRFNLSKQMDLYGLDKHDYTGIRSFWEKNLGSRAKNLLELALA